VERDLHTGIKISNRWAQETLRHSFADNQIYSYFDVMRHTSPLKEYRALLSEYVAGSNEHRALLIENTARSIKK